MRWNFNHLYYFWVVAREGGVARAAESLHLTPQTISGQLRQLQAQFPEPLLVKTGRRLRLTALGERVFEQAGLMFGAAEDLENLSVHGEGRLRQRLRIGAADVIPKFTVRRLLLPALELSPRPRLIVREVDLADLLDDLAHGRLDVVIADRPLANAGHVRAVCHPLLTSNMALYAAPHLADSLRAGFPDSLDGAPMIMPMLPTYARRLLDDWLHSHDTRPEIVAELDDTALAGTFAQMGVGVVALPAEHRVEVEAQYGLQQIGVCAGVEEQFFAVTTETPDTNPALEGWLGSWR